MAAEGRVDITVKAHDKTGGVFKKIGGSVKTLGKIAATAAAAAGVAIAGLAAKGIKDFIAFEEGMNEVFTLMPDISGEAMGEMSGQVKQLAKDMGILPEDVVPALYQSISAGVPRDNVFGFLETAQKAAVGGVTDLETAVDGISSTVNAYGSDVITAAESSDIMFTAVRLGKTTFGELSTSLADVNPLAAGLGVGFENVGAALATMTSQGTKTNKATTQMRALLQELGTAGTEVFGIFEDAAGATFPDFIAGGGDMGDVMGILRDTAAETGVPIQDMFGSVEAGLAALQLGGDAFDTFQDNLSETQDSSGATEAAFERMNQSFSRVVERIKASLKVALLDLGEAFLPVLNKVAELADKWLPILSEFVTGTVVPALERLFKKLAMLSSDGLGGFFKVFEDGSSKFAVFIEMLGVGEETAQKIATGLIEAGAAVIKFVEPIVENVKKFVKFKDVLLGLGIVLGAVVISSIVSLVAAIGPLLLAAAALIAIIALVRNAWENNWLGIRDKVKVIVTFLKEFLRTAITNIRNWWAQNGEAILAKASEIWNTILTVVTVIINTVWSVIKAVAGAIKSSWDSHGADILASAQKFWDAVMGYIGRVIGRIKNQIIIPIANAIKGFWDQHGASLLEGATIAWNAIKLMIDNAMNNIGIVLDIFTAIFEGDWDSFLSSVKELWSGIWDDIKLKFILVKATLGRVAKAIAEEILEKIRAKVNEVKADVVSDFELIMGVFGDAKAALQGFWDKLIGVFNWLKNKVFSIDVRGPIGALLGAGSQGGNQAGTAFFPGGLTWVGEQGPELVGLPRGSKIMSNRRSRNMMRDGGGGDTNIVNNYYSIEATYPFQPEGSVRQDIRTMQMLRE